MSEAWEKVKLLPIPIFPADSWWYVMRALKQITFKMAPTGNEVDSGVSFELHRIVLLLFFLLDAAKTSSQTQNICRMKRNMKGAETLQTFRKQ